MNTQAPFSPTRWFRRNGPSLMLILTVLSAGLILIGTWNEVHRIPPKPDEVRKQVEKPPNLEEGIVRTLYNTVRIFVFDVDPKDEIHDPWLKAGAVMAVVLGATVAFGVLGLLWEKSRLWALNLRGGHVVVCGIGRIGENLARCYLRGVPGISKRVVVIERDKDHRAIERLRDLGALVISGDATDPDILNEARVRKAKEVWVVTGEDAANLEVAVELVSPARKSKHGGGKNPLCHIHLTDSDQADLLKLAPAFLRNGRRAEIEVFNLYQGTSRHLMLDGLAARMPRPGEVAHYFLLGFGAMGHAIALELALQAHFENDRRARLTIIGENMRAARDAFLSRHPAFCPVPGALDLGKPPEGVDRWDHAIPEIRPVAEARSKERAPMSGRVGVEYVCNAEFIDPPLEFDCRSFAETLRMRMRQPGIRSDVIVCFEGDGHENFEIALHLKRRLREIPDLRIFVWLPRFSALARLFESESAVGPQIVPFGMPQDVCNPDALSSNRIESMAAIMHALYNDPKKPGDSQQPDPDIWKSLPETFQRANIRRAVHTEIKLATLGLRRDLSGSVCRSDVVEIIPPHDCNRIGPMEHNRWMADRLMDGWIYEEEKDVPNMKHKDLVPYENLSDEDRAKDISAGEELLTWVKKCGQVMIKTTE